MLNSYRLKLSPAMRSAVYYAFFWGFISFYDPFINVYFTELHLSGRQIGVLGGLIPLMVLVFAPLVSSLADRKGWRVRLLSLACLVLGLSVYLLGLPTTFTGILFAFLLYALARSAIPPLGDGLVAGMSSKKGFDYGRVRLWGSIVYALFSIVSGFIWQKTGFKPMFVVTGLLFILVALSAALLEEDPPEPEHKRISPFRLIRQDRFLFSLFAATILLGAGQTMAQVFSSVYMNHLGGNKSMVGLLLGISAFMEIPTMFFGGRIMRRIGHVNTLLLAYALLIAGAIGTGLTSSPWVMVAAGGLRGMGFGFYFVSTVVVINKHTPPALATTLLSIIFAGANGFAPLLASPLAGWIYDLVSPSAVFFVAAGFNLIAMAILYFNQRVPTPAVK